MRYAYGRGECRLDWDVQGASIYCSGIERSSGGMHHEGTTIFLTLVIDVDGHVEIDMTPPNVLAETVKQVVKILKSPGCRSVLS